MSASPKTIERLRDASRQLVRELGFMRSSLAGTDLPPSAVHALIEIDGREGITAKELAERLRLEKSSVSRMLRKLIEAGEVAEEQGEQDGRTKSLVLTYSGRKLVGKIHSFARAQVKDALERLQPEEHRIVVDGISLYAHALGAEAPAKHDDDVRIERGYRTGLIARTTEMHARYYARAAGFGQSFESVVASGLAEFCGRLDNPRNAIWTAMQDQSLVGAVAIDGEDLDPGVAHLRWFIVEDGQRGRGIGKKLLSTAIAFSEASGFSEIDLWTFAGLDAARHLYEAHGFVCVEERPGTQWGAQVNEQRFVRRVQ
ncbi:helix-turn-helix domain-containing GNAT family N-acetyltransferase [Enhydrobacter aerosaccus]